MKSNDSIEKLLRSMEATLGPTLEQQTLNDTMAAFASVDRPSLFWRNIMQNQTLRRAAFSLTALATVLGIVLFFGPLSNAAALAELVEAMKQKAWIHAQGEVTRGDHVEPIENWINFQDGIEIDKKAGGDVRYSHQGEDTRYRYDAGKGTLTITSMSDDYASPRRVPLPSSPIELLEQIMNSMSENDTAKVSREVVTKEGRQVEVIRIVSRIEGDTVIEADNTLTVDLRTQLLESIEAIMQENSVTLATMKVRLSYPDQGPIDIYAVGVPSDVLVIDRRPKMDADEETPIEFKLLEDTEDPTQNKLILYGGLNMDLVWIPAGQFLMGSPEAEIGYPDSLLKTFSRSKKEGVRNVKHPGDEDPQHLVRIERGFYMSQFETTCTQFRKFRKEFRKSRHSGFQMDADDQPAGVSLEDARAFCQWLSDETGLLVQLPCEAEWEYACRSGTQTRFYWGDSESLAGQYANLADQSFERFSPETMPTFSTEDGYPCLAPVGQFLPNSFGLYDMIGNIPEWPDGVYSDKAYSIDPSHHAYEKASEDEHYYIRGGSWQASIINGRCSSRWQGAEDALTSTMRSYTGFRVIVRMP